MAIAPWVPNQKKFKREDTSTLQKLKLSIHSEDSIICHFRKRKV